MKTEIVSQEKNIIIIKAEFEAEQVNRAIDKTIKDLSKKANIKGFRKGHVPRRTLEMFYGMKGICAETLEKVVTEAIDKMIEEYELKLIAEPSVEPDELKEGSAYEFNVTFEVTPAVSLPDIESLDAVKTIYVPTEEMRDDNIARILQSRSELVPTYEERELTEKDCVSVKYTKVGSDGNPVRPSSDEGSKTEIDLAEENIRPEIREAIIGKKPGDKSTVEFSADDDRGDGKPMDKETVYEIEILGILKRVTPELNDETVTEISQSKLKTVDEFKEEIMSQLKASADEHSQMSLRDSATEALCEASEVELPDTLITRQTEALKAEQAQRIKRDSGMELDDFFEKSGLDRETYENELADAAKKIVKRALVLEALADANDIQWTPEELTSEIRAVALNSRIDPAKFQEYVYGDRERLFEMAERVRNRKAIDFLVTKVKVTEKKEEIDTEQKD